MWSFSSVWCSLLWLLGVFIQQSESEDLNASCLKKTKKTHSVVLRAMGTISPSSDPLQPLWPLGRTLSHPSLNCVGAEFGVLKCSQPVYMCMHHFVYVFTWRPIHCSLSGFCVVSESPLFIIWVKETQWGVLLSFSVAGRKRLGTPESLVLSPASLF